MLSIGRDAGTREEGAIPPLPYGKQGFPQGNSHPHPQGPADLKERTEGAADETRTGLQSKAAATGRCYTTRKMVACRMHPQGPFLLSKRAVMCIKIEKMHIRGDLQVIGK